MYMPIVTHTFMYDHIYRAYGLNKGLFLLYLIIIAVNDGAYIITHHHTYPGINDGVYNYTQVKYL